MTPETIETLHRKVAEFEAAYGYDASHSHEMIDAAPASAAIFATLPMMVDRAAAPASALAAAGMATFYVEDCQPCAQIGLDISLQSGVDAETLRAIVAGDKLSMGPDAALAWRFARAVLAHDEAAAAPLRREILHQWGSAGLMAVSLQITIAKMFPTVKYALGHGHPIQELKVGGKPAPLGLRTAEAA
jgi:hypothetical protein